MSENKNVCDVICETLYDCGVTDLFGLPGTQNVPLIEAIRKSKLKMIVPTHELAASFMACGYYRAIMKPAVIVTIPGPGFTYTLTGLAEAKHDSSACILLTIKSISSNSRPFALQEIDQPQIAKELVKKSFLIESPDKVSSIIHEAVIEATSGEPGPVMVEIDSSIFDSHAYVTDCKMNDADTIDENDLKELADRLQNSKKPIFIIGQGASEASEEINKLKNIFNPLVITTSSGRGTISDLDMAVVCTDISSGDYNLINNWLSDADLIVGFGCKFTHNGSAGFNLNIEREKFIHIDKSEHVLNANYPASLTIEADIKIFLEKLSMLISTSSDENKLSQWDKTSMNEMRRLWTESANVKNQPELTGPEPDSWSRFFTAIYKEYPKGTKIITDSGMHQMLARSYATITTPRGLITPSDFQSMGFGLPAAIGASIGSDKEVVLIVGDGGFNMTGMETLTAVKENLSLTIVIFADKKLGLIRNQQFRDYGYDYAVSVQNPNYASLADSFGARYFLYEGNAEVIFEHCAKLPGVKIVEVPLKDSDQLTKTKFSRIGKETIRKFIPTNLINKLKE